MWRERFLSAAGVAGVALVIGFMIGYPSHLSLLPELWKDDLDVQEVSLAPLNVLNWLRATRDEVALAVENAVIAVGYNVCLDAVVDAFEMFEAAGVMASSKAQDHESIGSLEELASTFSFHFAKSSGGERPVTDSETFNTLEDALRTVKHRLLVGGNAAIMARVLASDYGFQNVILGGQVGPKIRSLLPSNIQIVTKDEGGFEFYGDRIDVRKDEVHIIAEYAKGSSWGNGMVANRANRFIVSHDHSNAVLATLESLNDYVVGMNKTIDLMIISGFHMLDAKSKAFRVSRLKDATASIKNIPDSTRLHLELASVGDNSVFSEIADALFYQIDSIGLNEQELGSLFLALDLAKKHPEIDVDSIMRTKPDLQSVSLAITAILNQFSGADPKVRGRRLSRIHFHCFSYHIIAQQLSVSKKWANIQAAVAAGSIKTTEKSCSVLELGNEDIMLSMKGVFEVDGFRLSLSSETPVVQWTPKESSLILALAPVLACKKVVQTVGLGDSISASALAYQIS